MIKADDIVLQCGHLTFAVPHWPIAASQPVAYCASCDDFVRVLERLSPSPLAAYLAQLGDA